MAVKTVVTCDRCAVEWETETGVETYKFNKRFLVFCKPCATGYERILADLDSARVKAIEEWLEGW